jgi:biotin carboxylase
MTPAEGQEITIICLASYHKGEEFLRECRQMGARVILITREKQLSKDWPHDSLAAIITVPDDATPSQYIQAASRAARDVKVDLLVALEEYDVLTTAKAREHLCLAGMTHTEALLFRDKLMMRVRAREAGILQPEFVPLFNYQEIGEFMESVEPPWVIKPRADASAMRIRRLHSSEGVWRSVEALDAHTEFHQGSPSFLLEQFIAGDVYHVDSLVSAGRVVFAGVNAYAHPPLDISLEGGVPISYTVKYGSPDQRKLLKANRKLIKTLGLRHGVTHAEFIKSAETGEFYFLEVAARVGGALTAETLEAASGINLWREWARIEIAAHKGEPYRLPTASSRYAGLALCLARQEYPDTYSFTDPEIVYRLRKPNHVGLIVRSAKQERVLELLKEYSRRFNEEFMMTLPPQERPE